MMIRHQTQRISDSNHTKRWSVKMELLKALDEWIQKGFEISYDIVNQFENGYEEDVIAGNMPNFTYTFHICENEENLWVHSVDSLETGFTLSLKWLNENC